MVGMGVRSTKAKTDVRAQVDGVALVAQFHHLGEMATAVVTEPESATWSHYGLRGRKEGPMMQEQRCEL